MYSEFEVLDNSRVGEYDKSQFEVLDNSTVGDHDKSQFESLDNSVDYQTYNVVVEHTSEHSGSVNFESGGTKNGGMAAMYRLDGNQTMNSVSSGSVNLESRSYKNGRRTAMCQLDGNQTIDSVSSYDTEEELECEPTQATLIPAPQLPGQPFTLEVDDTEEVAAPSSLPLTMVANFRSAYNKVKNIKQNLYVQGLDFLIASESWERPHYDLNQLLGSPTYKVLSYCRGRETPATRMDGKNAGKLYPGKTGGGAAIIYNRFRFEATYTDISVPLGVEAKWCVFTPLQPDANLQRVQRIGIAAIYIAPRSPYKEETVDHIIHTIHTLRAKYDSKINFLLAGDFNRVGVQDILDSYGALHQVCGVPTRKGASLQLILTDLHTLMHPPTAQLPIQKDEGAKGVDADHQTLILAPKASALFVVKREKKTVISRPMPQSSIDAFCLEMTQHKWEAVKGAESANEKTTEFHKYMRYLLDKYFPEKTVTMTNLDKHWMTPDLKQLLRQVQRTRLIEGKSSKFKRLWSKFRRLKRFKIKTLRNKMVNELKEGDSGQWYSIMRKFGGIDQMSRQELRIKSLEGLSNRECAEAVAQSFASVSQEYSPLDRTRLPAFLPAGRPMQVSIFQVMDRIKRIGKTKSTLPIDIPDRLRTECALDLAEPMTDIINSCLLAGSFPRAWRREWVTPVPKLKPGEELKNCDDVRKVASTSDYSKVFETFLRDWITEDIGEKIDINQFAGKKGVGTEHLLVAMIDRILGQLDKVGMRAVFKASVDWASAFSRTDPTITITKFIKMGVRPSLINILIEFLEERQMTVKFNSEESSLYSLIGGGPQGCWTGQACFITASDDNAEFVAQDDRYKFSDDLNILEVVILGNILTEYDFTSHVASDIGLGERFIPAQELDIQENLERIAEWSDLNLMKLKESKTDYMVFSRAREPFATRLTLNSKLIERKYVNKCLGVWLQSDGKWEKNTREICKGAYIRIQMLTKLKYSGASTEDLIHLYKQFVRGKLEYSSVVWHSSLTERQARSLERCQAVALKVILSEMFISYEAACEMTGLENLSVRRTSRCLEFGLKSLKHPQNSRFFPQNPSVDNQLQIRDREPFRVNFARTAQYKNSAIPYIQRKLNENSRRVAEDGASGPGGGHAGGTGQGARGTGQGAGGGHGGAQARRHG